MFRLGKMGLTSYQHKGWLGKVGSSPGVLGRARPSPDRGRSVAAGMKVKSCVKAGVTYTITIGTRE